MNRQNIISKLVIAALCAFGSTVSGQITEDFSPGHGNVPGGLFTGKAEGGWNTGWLVKRPNTSVAVDRDVIDSFPLAAGTGNYLQVSGVPASYGIWGIARQFAQYPNREYKWVRRDRPYTINFLFRVDDLGGWSRGDSVTIGEANSSAELMGTGVMSAFLLSAHHSPSGAVLPGHWALYDGTRDGKLSVDRFVDTGMRLRVGITYAFSIRINPLNLSWQVTINDGEQVYTSDWLGFRAGGLGTGMLAFLRSTNSAGDFTSFSIDNLVIDSGI
jgi:hypothetical protein